MTRVYILQNYWLNEHLITGRFDYSLTTQVILTVFPYNPGCFDCIPLQSRSFWLYSLTTQVILTVFPYNTGNFDYSLTPQVILTVFPYSPGRFDCIPLQSR